MLELLAFLIEFVDKQLEKKRMRRRKKRN